MAMQTYAGSCHCGAVRFTAELDLQAGTGKCNCSICTKTRNWSALTQPAQFHLVSGEEALSDYQFNTASVHWSFCRHCGVRSFGTGNIPEVGGAFVSIMVSSLDGVDDAILAALPVRYANGRDNDWQHSPAVTQWL
jgi:hypothetical protein